MTAPIKNEVMDSELESRLNELFSEDEAPREPEPKEPKAVSPLAELKKTVLSIDWEITPEAIDGFLDQIALLKEAYQRDKTVFSFFQILGALGQYVKSNRSQAHPNAFMLLNSVFGSLEEILGDPKMGEVDKRRRLQTVMQSYQELRQKIISRRAAEAKPAVKAAAAASPAAPPTGGSFATRAELAQALAEVKEFIRAEFKALREELKR